MVNNKRAVSKRSGEATKAVLLNVALELFSVSGYADTSTRDISKKANINQAGIAYHFMSKEGLFSAVNDWVVNCIDAELSFALKKASSSIQDDISKKEISSVLINDLMKIFWADKDIEHEVNFFKRIIVIDTDLYKKVVNPHITHLEKIINYLVGKDNYHNMYKADIILNTIVNSDNILNISAKRISMKRKLEIAEPLKDTLSRILFS